MLSMQVSYDDRTCHGLRMILIKRKLALDGRKGELIRRLKQYDAEHPFEFLKLPAEMRNMIYKLAAAEKVMWEHSRAPDWGAELSYVNNERQIQQPAFFKTCRQVRAEGLLFFYIYRRFSFNPTKNKSMVQANRQGIWGWFLALKAPFIANLSFITIRLVERNCRSLSEIQALVTSLRKRFTWPVTIELVAMSRFLKEFLHKLAKDYLACETVLQFSFTRAARRTIRQGGFTESVWVDEKPSEVDEEFLKNEDFVGNANQADHLSKLRFRRGKPDLSY